MEQVNTRLKQMDRIGEYKVIKQKNRIGKTRLKQMDRIGEYKVIKQMDRIGKIQR